MTDASRSGHADPGCLYVVATPLGNLEDLSERARRVLADVAVIACEDTRRTAKLLSRFSIRTPTVSCHRFNEAARLDALLARIEAGEDIAFVSDGGTPAISDPGAVLVEAALDRGLAVHPIPGPSSPVALLSASGLPADRFVFDGYLPHRAAERRRRLRELAREPRTVVVLEAPHRIRAALADLHRVLGPRRIVVGRELTKVHERILRGTAEEIAARLATEEERGEFTIAIAGAAPGEAGIDGGDAEERERLLATWQRALDREGGDPRRALRAAAREIGVGRAELRRRLDEIGDDRARRLRSG